MTEIVVHVTTLEQWKSVLDVWFKQGYIWFNCEKEYLEDIFKIGGRYLFLDDSITWSASNYNSEPFIEYQEFMEQQKEENKMKTYYVTQEQLELLEDLKWKEQLYPLHELLRLEGAYKVGVSVPKVDEEGTLLRYLGGDESIEFKVKEKLYRLWRKDDGGDIVYMNFTSSGNPDWAMSKDVAFTAPLEEIKKWQTPAWSVEEAD